MTSLVKSELDPPELPYLMTAMKKKSIIVGIAGLAALAGITTLAWEVFTVTDPYLVSPLTSSPAPASASVGHSVDSGSRTLSVVSSSDIIVVADPGASFKYEVIWIVERPREDGSNALKEFICNLPEYAAVDQIKPLGTPVPTEIQQTANGRQW